MNSNSTIAECSCVPWVKLSFNVINQPSCRSLANLCGLVVSPYKENVPQFAEESNPFVDEYLTSLSVKQTCHAADHD